ncbi:MAG: glycosyltransferase [Thermoplasmata archaeon]|jgi:glycosyltransferase involved in cell wall biosynthesis
MIPAPLVFVVPLPPSYRGGTEEYAYRLVRSMALVAPVRVLTTTVRWDPKAELLSTGSATVDRLRATELFERPLLWNGSARRTLFKAVRTSRLLNLNMPFPFVESPASREAKREGIPVVLTYHMDADLGASQGHVAASLVTRAYRRWSAHPALETADVVVSNSRGYAEASPVLRQHLAKVRVIAKGVDPERLGLSSGSTGPVPIAPPSTGGRQMILFVGRLVPYKGLPHLLEATDLLVREGHDVEVKIAGRGPQRPELEEKARALGLDARVSFLGFVPDRSLGDLYRGADVTVVPSLGLMESSATTLEEASTCGSPVVGSDLPGAAETIPNDGRRGILVPPGNSGALAEAIGRILRQPRPPPPEHVRTWEAVAEDYRRLFLELGVPLGPLTRPERRPVARLPE